MTPLGRVCELVRYPVKSMFGIATDSAFLGFHGITGDRRFAFRRVGDSSGFPWLTASRCHELILYQPAGGTEVNGEPLPTHVRTPDGSVLELRSDDLRNEIARRWGGEVELMMLKNGIFDDAAVSLISLTTLAAIGRASGVEVDRRRLRPNVVLETDSLDPFMEDSWVGGTLVFGDGADGPAVSVTARDQRCVMINLDPETAAADARVTKAVAGMNGNNAGVYGTVVRAGILHAGQPVRLVR